MENSEYICYFGYVAFCSIFMLIPLIIPICLQFFLHEKLDYRGVILFPWVARVFNRNNKAFPILFDRSLVVSL